MSTQEVFVYDGHEMLLRYSAILGTETDYSYLKTDYLWGPAVDMLLAQEDINYNYHTVNTNWALGRPAGHDSRRCGQYRRRRRQWSLHVHDVRRGCQRRRVAHAIPVYGSGI